MAKTYSLEALWPLLEFRKPEPPLLAIAESGSVSYVANADGIWLVADLKGLTDEEMKALTGLHPANLGSKKIEGVDGYGYAYGMQDGTPLLPLPFTAAELIAFEERTPEVISEHINRGDDTDAWIADLGKVNPDAAELARGIYGGNWPLVDIADAKTDGAAKPRFRLADGIKPEASAIAFKLDRPRERDREHAIETARLAEIARLEARDKYEARKKAEKPTPVANATKVVSEGATHCGENGRVGPSWRLTMPKRFQGYGKPLYDHLKAAHAAGKTRPTARNVLDDWKLNKPADVAEVSNDGLKYYDASGNTKPADLPAIRKVIERMTK